MDAAGFASAILSFIGAAKTIVVYIKDVKDGPAERQELADALTLLGALLQGLKVQFAHSEDPSFGIARILAQPDGVFDQLRLRLEKLQKKLEPADNVAGKIYQNAVKWPFAKAEVSELLSKIERVKSCILLALQGDEMYVFNIFHYSWLNSE
jgi:hypothetical protein